MEGNDFSVNDLYSKFQGEGNKKDKSILDLVRFHNNRMEKQIGAGVAFTTWEKYHQTQNHLSGFLSKFYKRKDFPINELKDKFLIDFEYYLQSERGFLMTSNK